MAFSLRRTARQAQHRLTWCLWDTLVRILLLGRACPGAKRDCRSRLPKRMRSSAGNGAFQRQQQRRALPGTPRHRCYPLIRTAWPIAGNKKAAAFLPRLFSYTAIDEKRERDLLVTRYASFSTYSSGVSPFGKSLNRAAAPMTGVSPAMIDSNVLRSSVSCSIRIAASVSSFSRASSSICLARR